MLQRLPGGTLVLSILIAGACMPRHSMPMDPVPQRIEPPPPLERPPLVPQPSETFDVPLSPLHDLDHSRFDMPIHVNDHVLAYIDVFTGRARGRFAQWLQLQGRYEPIIREQLVARGVPAEMIYLAMIESGYAPTAVSHANAVGLWQFMAATGRLEGLLIDDFVDERRDPVRASEAAAKHMRRLYDRYGSWYLAAAAYNAGSGRIDRALAAGADGRRGNDSLYWAIRDLLPLETRNYVPQLIAASIIGTHRHLFGFESVMADAPIAYEVVEVPDATEFAVIADAAGVDRGVIASLNTHFTKAMTPPGRAVQVRLPVGRAEPFRTAYAALPATERVRTRTHVVAAGESLARIAARYGTTVAAVQSHNGIDRADRIAVGQRLVIPGGGAVAAGAPTPPQAAPARAQPAASPVASPGPTAQPAATPAVARPATPTAAVAAAETVAGAVAEPAPAVRPATTRSISAPAAGYTVRPGDTLTGIAARHDLSLARLLELNGLHAGAVIRPGQQIDVGISVYRVQTGDTLSSIARRHGVSTRELMDWNALGSDVIRPGDTLELRH
jgi:membrane-bound lytic murein transglycosylase D